MDVQSLEEAVKDAVNLLKGTPAIRRRGDVSYTFVVRVGYDEIKKLKSDGYTWDAICEALSKSGALNADASAKNLCSAFIREVKRRAKHQQTSDSNIEAKEVTTKKEEKEWETTAVTRFNPVVKNSDGSFNY